MSSMRGDQILVKVLALEDALRSSSAMWAILGKEQREKLKAEAKA